MNNKDLTLGDYINRMMRNESVPETSPEPVDAPNEAEAELDPILSEEYDVVAHMLKTAEEHGLLVEVVHSFGEYLLAGDEFVEAARCALLDWDC